MFTNSYPTQWPKRVEVALLLTAAVVALGVLLPISAQAQTESVLYSFNYPTYPPLNPYGCPPGSTNAQPHTGLLFYKGGLYGTTPLGGTGEKKDPDSDDGMVFRLTKPKSGPPWTETTLHSFIPVPETGGLYPCSRLIQKNGVLYGSAKLGGFSGFGTLFALVPPNWTEDVLYTFLGQSDGAEPFDGLTMGSDGSLFGVTRDGLDAVPTDPTVFQLTPGGSLVTLVTNDQGIVYNGDLLLDSTNGSLFGTTQNGGANGYGNVFQLSPTASGWVYADLYDFTGGTDGAYPNGGLAGGTGDLFGTTQGGGTGTGTSGGGVLFELRQVIAGNPYTLFIQHTFAGPISDGSAPGAGLYRDATGTLWGTTMYGGPFRLHFVTYGTIFKLYPDPRIVHEWHYAVVYDFAGEPDGAYPQGLLTGDLAGNVYGTTNAGGASNEGTVFQLTP